MRTITVALATALLLWTSQVLQAQPLQQLSLPGLTKADTATPAEIAHTKKAVTPKRSFQNLSTSLGNPAGKKSTGLSKREADSLQQIMLLRKKF